MMGRNAYITIKRFLREFYMNLSAGIIPFVLTIVSVIIFIFQETSPVMRYLISGLIISASGLAIYNIQIYNNQRRLFFLSLSGRVKDN
jgi:hypothetical protein